MCKAQMLLYYSWAAVHSQQDVISPKSKYQPEPGRLLHGVTASFTCQGHCK